MPTLALIAFSVSLFVLLVLSALVASERRRGQRFFGIVVRVWLDRVVGSFEVWLVASWGHFIKYILQLHWYYSIHSVLKTLLRMIVATYTYFETLFENNRVRTKQLRAEKRQISKYNHLREMAAHKKDTALTPAEQKKLRQKKLEDEK